MIEYEGKLRNWGNSIGIVIPKEEVEKEKLEPNQKVKVLITPVNPVKVKDIFGIEIILFFGYRARDLGKRPQRV